VRLPTSPAPTALSSPRSRDLPSRAIREQIGASIQLVVQQARLSDGSRKVTEISEVTGLDRKGEFQTRALYP